MGACSRLLGSCYWGLLLFVPGTMSALDAAPCVARIVRVKFSYAAEGSCPVR